MVGMARFELATSAPPVQRANQATLHPDQAAGIVVAPAWFSMKKRIPRPSAWPSGYLDSFFGSSGLGLTVSQRWLTELIKRSPPALSAPMTEEDVTTLALPGSVTRIVSGPFAALA